MEQVVVFTARQHLKRMPKANLAHYIERKLAEKSFHIMRRRPVRAAVFIVFETGQQVTKSPYMLQNYIAHGLESKF